MDLWIRRLLRRAEFKSGYCIFARRMTYDSNLVLLPKPITIFIVANCAPIVALFIRDIRFWTVVQGLKQDESFSQEWKQTLARLRIWSPNVPWLELPLWPWSCCCCSCCWAPMFCMFKLVEKAWVSASCQLLLINREQLTFKNINQTGLRMRREHRRRNLAAPRDAKICGSS